MPTVSRLGRAVSKALKNSDNADDPIAERSAAAMLDQKRQNNPATAPDALSRFVEQQNHKPGVGFHDGGIMQSNPDAHKYDLVGRRRLQLRRGIAT